MWKAIINWINSKAYRCEHNWEQISKTNVYDESSSGKYPTTVRCVYRCVKCCESKTINL